MFQDFKVPDEAIGCGFHEAVRGVLSHHLVIRDGKIANYHPYPPTPWNASPRDAYGTPGPYEDAVQGHADLRGERPGRLQGIDIMRTVRSFDPCLPCGVHMYLGDGKMLEAGALADVRRSTAAERQAMDDARGTRADRARRGAARARSRASRPGARELATASGAGAARPVRRGRSGA